MKRLFSILAMIACTAHGQMVFRSGVLRSGYGGLAVSPAATGIVGLLASDSFSSALSSNWSYSGLTLTVTNNELEVKGRAQLGDRADYLVPQSLGDDYEIRWKVRNPVYDANQAGVGLGVWSWRNARGWYGLFSMDSGSDGKKALLYYQAPSGTWLLKAKSAAITYSAGDLVECYFARTNGTYSFHVTNLTAGSYSSVLSSNATFAGSAPYAEGPHTLSLICYKGTNYIDDIRWTNRVPTPVGLLVIGDSIAEGSSSGLYEQGYSWGIRTNKSYAVRNYAGGSSSITNVLNGLTEIYRYNPTNVLLMIGSNDVQYSYPAATVQSNYHYLVTNLTAQGIGVIHAAPPPRDSYNMSWLLTYISTNWPSTYIGGTFTNLASGTALDAWADSGDGVHPNAAGHAAILTNILNSGLFP